MAGSYALQGVLLEDETLRDGLQLENRIFSLEEKLEIYGHLAEAGVKRIQVGSFVHPKRVPQMADTGELVSEILSRHGSGGPLISTLILNDKGLERALDCGVKHVSMSVSVSNTHSMKNAGKTAEEALSSMKVLIGQATGSGLAVRAGLQCSFGCVYESAISEKTVIHAAEKLAGAGAREINLADTTGMANPLDVTRLVAHVGRELPEINISLHLHDTRGLGLANMYAGHQAGVRTFDTCSGGLGGCPFVTGAAGNVPTEDAVNMFSSIGVATGVDLIRVCDTVEILERLLDRKLPGRMKTVLDAKIRDDV
ncbi:MAG: hydroxymethylglutaryl-CoA lyase [Pseudomonadota bacterium]|jgi:hydroxymethylglutaryl-CoA lyase